MPLGRDAMGGLAEVSAVLRSSTERRQRRQQAREKAIAMEELQVRQAEEELHDRRAAAAALRERMGRHTNRQRAKAEEQEEWRTSHHSRSQNRTSAAKQARSRMEARRREKLLAAEARSEEVSRRFLLGKLEECADRLERKTDPKHGSFGPSSAAIFRPTTGPGQTEWLQGISPRWRPPVQYSRLACPPLTPNTPADVRKSRAKSPARPPEPMPPIRPTITAPPMALAAPPSRLQEDRSDTASRDEERRDGAGQDDRLYSWPPRSAPAFRIPC